MSTTKTSFLTAALITPLAIALLMPVAGAPLFASDVWLQWGGPGRDFKSPSTGLARTWPASGPKIIWSRDLGEGYSAILADGKTLYTMYRQGENEVVVALDARSGKTIWEYAYESPVHEKQSLNYGKGPNATPLIVGDRIYTVGFRSRAHALDKKKGTLIWSHDLIGEHDGQVVIFGNSSSPIAYGDTVVFLVGGEKHAAVAYDLEEGSLSWKSEASWIGYSSPIIIDVGGEDQLVFMTPDEVIGIGMQDGAIKWRQHHENQYRVNCASPWWGEDDLLFVSSQGDVGSRTLRLTRHDGKTEVEEIARNKKVRIFHNAVLRVGDHVYGSSGSELIAHNIRTGKVHWREEGYPEANLMMTGDDTVIWLDENGKLGLATVTPEKLTVHATHQLLEKPSWTAPTLVGTRLYARDKSRIVALDLGAVKRSPQAGAR